MTNRLQRAARTYPRGAVALLGVVATVLFGWVVLNSAFFDVKDIRVLGARTISRDEVRRLAAIQPAENLLRLSLEDVAARIATHPWIADVEVSRDLPATLVLRIAERSPAGWLLDPNGIAVVAGDGTVLDRPATEPRDLPALGHWSSELPTGGRLSSIPAALEVGAAMPAALRIRTAVLAEGADGVRATLKGGAEALYGSPGELTSKHRVLLAVLRWAETEGIEVGSVDLRIPAAPTMLPKGADTPVVPDLQPTVAPSPGG